MFTAGVNFLFNWYENDWQLSGELILDSIFDTAIGVGAYYMAAGTMSLITASLAVAGLTVPGAVVFGGIILLGLAFDAFIRWITGYNK